MDECVEYDCIDFKKLLLIKAKELSISDDQSHILLIIMVMQDLNMKPINPTTISKLSSLSAQKIDKILVQLLDNHLIVRNNGYLSLKPLYDSLLKKEVKQESEVDLLSLFEDAFGRSLSQSEINIIMSFKSNGYSDEMIVDALNEAVKSNVINFRYIERILENWSLYGVKKRFVKAPEKVSSVPDNIKDYNWWDHHE